MERNEAKSGVGGLSWGVYGGFYWRTAALRLFLSCVRPQVHRSKYILCREIKIYGCMCQCVIVCMHMCTCALMKSDAL